MLIPLLQEQPVDAREERKTTAGYLTPSVIVNDHREQARSHSCGGSGR
jgi:hypothetical protein